MILAIFTKILEKGPVKELYTPENALTHKIVWTPLDDFVLRIRNFTFMLKNL